MPLNTASVRIDGSKCYSQTMGGIYAEGYIDLNGPDPIIDGDYADEENTIAVACTRIGDTQLGSTESN